MNPKKVVINRKDLFSLTLVGLTALSCIVISIFCLYYKNFYIFQNLYYFPIVLACVYFARKGFIFSIGLSLVYFILTDIFTNNPQILLEALIRCVVFVAIAGVVTLLTLSRARAYTFGEVKRIYESIVSFSPLAIAIHRDGKLLYVNPAGLKLLGAKSLEQVFEKPIAKFVHPDFHKVIAERLKKVAETGQAAQPLEEVYLRLDGTPIDVEVVTSAFLFNGSTAFQTVINDISGRKLALQALRESEEKFKNIAENSPNMIFINKGGKVVYVNQNCINILGYTREEFLSPSFNFLNMIAPEDKKKIMQIYADHLKNGSVPPYEYALISKSGKRIEVINNSIIINYAGGPAVLGIVTDLTERKYLERELLRAKDNNFKKLFDGASDGIVVVDGAGKKFVMGNPAFCRMLGYSSEEIKSLGVKDIHPEKDLSHVLEVFQKQARGEISIARDLPVLRKNETVFYADIGATNIKFGDDNYVVGFFHDNSESKNAQEAIRKSEERFRQLFEASHDAIMTLEPPSWKFTSCNPATIKLFGAKNSAEFLNMGPWDISPEFQPDGMRSSEKAKQRIQQAMELGENFFEYTHKQMNGREFFATVLLTRVEIEKGKPFLLATVRDITKEKEAEAEIMMKGTLLEAESEASLDGVLAVNDSGRAILANKRFGQMWKIPDEIMATNDDKKMLKAAVSQLIDPKEFERKVRYLYDHKNEKSHDEIHFIDGRVFERYSSPLIDPAGKSLGRVWFFRDLTQQKADEAALRRMEELKKIDEIKSEVVSTVSHELRLPLTTVKEGVSLILDKVTGELNGEQEKIVRSIKNNIDRLARTINSILDVSKIESGKLKLFCQPFELNTVIEQVVSIYKDQAEKKKLELKVRVSSQKLELSGDQDKIFEIFSNLVSNAIKYTQNGWIEVSASEIADRVECSVADSGIGICEADLPKVFEKFQQFGGGFRTGAKGTGLGLAIVKGLVEAHKGTIRVESRLGNGTKFTFTLPQKSQLIK